MLTACSQIPKVIDIGPSEPIEKPKLVLTDIEKYNARDMTWIVVTPDNVEQVFADLKSKNISVVLFALDDPNYNKLTLNMADLLKLVQQQKAIIAAYQDYYEADEDKP
jgi:hypothetical protein